MHVLLTNDDGPPNDQASPYVRKFVEKLRSDTDWDLTIVVPERQRSWISKAHMIGEDVGAKYLYTSLDGKESHGPVETPHKELRTNKDWQEWTLLAGTPASCANIGVLHVGPKRKESPVDIVISGPNYGRNTSAAYIMSSGTVGGSLEAAIVGKRSISLSFSYTKYKHSDEEIVAGSAIAIQIIEHLLANWHPRVQIYSVNIPLFTGMDPRYPPKIHYAPILENNWTAVFSGTEDSETGKETFLWSPDYAKCDETVYAAGPGSDAWAVLHNEISVSPIRGVYQNIDVGQSTINLSKKPTLTSNISTMQLAPKQAYVENNDPYVFAAWETALRKANIEIVDKIGEHMFEYEDYDNVDFEARASRHNLVYSYVFRKAITRKNYLGRTVAHFVAKNPASPLKKAVPESFYLEVDYAEFLDDALDESFELRQEIENSDRLWILKPALGDRAHGIRVFRTIDDLQDAFDAFEEEDENDEGRMRQYVVQPCITDLMLVDNHKFHIRVYILCSGALKVWVYTPALALFAEREFDPESTDLSAHLTNTCIQGGTARVELLSDLNVPTTKIMDGVYAVVGDLFKAAVADPINFQPLPNALEFYGLDFLVDVNGGVHLLEVNAYPDFKQTGERLQPLVQGLFDATVQEVVAPFYGRPVEHNNNLKLVYDETLRK